MCLILFAYRVDPAYQLIVAANRDEVYKRPTEAAHFWEDCPGILAGRDLEKMGTWMGITKSGRFAALTNYRDPNEMTEGKQSRGALVADALKYNGPIQAYMESLVEKNSLYPGYNLLAGDQNDLYYYSNRGQGLQKLEPGIYGLSNHLLNTDWPKVKIGKERLTGILHGSRENLTEDLLTLLQNSDKAPDELLPDTGVPYKLEKLLSSMFIQSADYGTRSSTVMLMSDNQIHYTERSFPNGEKSFTVPVTTRNLEVFVESHD